MKSLKKMCSFDDQSSLFVYEMLDQFPYELSVVKKKKSRLKMDNIGEGRAIVHGQENRSLQPKTPNFKTILNALIILDH